MIKKKNEFISDEKNFVIINFFGSVLITFLYYCNAKLIFLTSAIWLIFLSRNTEI